MLPWQRPALATLDRDLFALGLPGCDPMRHGAQMNSNGLADGAVGMPLLVGVILAVRQIARHCP